jgi:hypothetical protein
LRRHLENAHAQKQDEVAKLRRQLESKRLKSQEDGFSATTHRDKMGKRNREEGLRAQIEILAVEPTTWAPPPTNHCRSPHSGT